jgi:hypothetical protein
MSPFIGKLLRSTFCLMVPLAFWLNYFQVENGFFWIYLKTRALQGVAYAPEWEVVCGCGCMDDKVQGEVEHGEDWWPSISRRKICVCPLIDGNQNQDGGCSGHLGWVVELIIERNLPLVTPNEPHKNEINRPRHLICPVISVIDGNQIQDGGHSDHLGWAAELIIERNLPLVTPISHRKIGSIDPGVCPIIDGY